MDQITNLDWEPEQTERDEFYAYLAHVSGQSSEELQEKAQRRFDFEQPVTQEMAEALFAVERKMVRALQAGESPSRVMGRSYEALTRDDD